MERELIKRRLSEQEKYSKSYLDKEIIPRDGLKKYQKFMQTNLIKAIIGPRRSGKTTLGMLLLEKKDFYYVNFDDDVLASLNSEELGVLLETLTEMFGKREYIFLDEIQNIEKWELFVNRLHRKEYNIILSGSNSNLLSRELSSHLGGRSFTLELLPFSFNEYLRANKIAKIGDTDEEIGLIKKRLRKFIMEGGFPETIIRIKDPVLKERYYSELFDTVVLRDISRRFNIRNTTELLSLVNMMINLFSTRVSLRKISIQIGISIHTISRYISYLEEAYLILSSKKFSYKPREMESAFKKYYAIDTGMINSKKTTLTRDFGKMLENIAAIEIKRRGYDLFYYLADEKYEVDFVLAEKNSIKQIIQVVDDEKDIPKREIKTGIIACERLKCSNLTILTWNLEKEEKKANVIVRYIPLWKWLLGL